MTDEFRHYHVWKLAGSNKAYFRLAKPYRHRQNAQQAKIPGELIGVKRSRMVLECCDPACLTDVWINQPLPCMGCDTQSQHDVTHSHNVG